MDQISMKIENDGTITVKTSAISAGNHVSADQLLEDMEKLIGGPVIKKQNPDAQNKVHLHSHEHAFAGGHSHDGGKSFHDH